MTDPIPQLRHSPGVTRPEATRKAGEMERSPERRLREAFWCVPWEPGIATAVPPRCIVEFRRVLRARVERRSFRICFQFLSHQRVAGVQQVRLVGKIKRRLGIRKSKLIS